MSKPVRFTHGFASGVDGSRTIVALDTKGRLWEHHPGGERGDGWGLIDPPREPAGAPKSGRRSKLKHDRDA